MDGEGDMAMGREAGRARRALVGVGVGRVALASMAAQAGAAATVVQASGPLVRYDNPYGDGTANPVLAGATARVHAVEGAAGKTIVTLEVDGLTPDREFGSHVHVGACNVNKAGGHYQNVPGTGEAFANPENEVWLDFETDDAGHGFAQAKVNWEFRSNGANAVIIHDHSTPEHDPVAGVAGPKLACLDVDF
jgi:Cu-Zn family superoxide dismutase